MTSGRSSPPATGAPRPGRGRIDPARVADHRRDGRRSCSACTSSAGARWSLAVAPHDYRLGSTGVLGVGVGLTAYMLGVRHAFDADHIASIDNTTRKLVGEGTPSLSAGFWFSLGHSSVVFFASLLLVAGVRSVAGVVQNGDSQVAADPRRWSARSSPARSWCSSA